MPRTSTSRAFTEGFYRKICGGELAPVLDTLRYLKHETDVWFEITTLLIPGENDSDAELDAMTRWVVEELGPDVPMHFTAFHPDYKMLDSRRRRRRRSRGRAASRWPTACATPTPATSTTRRAAAPPATPAASG